ncbi:AMP-binding protein [Vibrio breoganii]|uniref:AMP-binding protein n=1 Tax=Vibrio breoganii TaxID=553239 RepID=UPI0002E9EC88|nr:AMP-binding protein [Vibrio breoganii]OED84849.1 AMP-fatty acid ligase [Vibrio breoganii ZF-55]
MNYGQSDSCSVANLLVYPRAPQSTVAVSDDMVFSWQVFQADVAHFTAILKRHPAARIALCFSNSYLFAVAFIASCYAKKSLVIPGNHQPNALLELTKHFDLLLHDEIVSLDDTIDSLFITSKTRATPLRSWSSLKGEELTITLFTSGSSGQPKAIEKTLKQLDSEIALLEQLWGRELNTTLVQSTVSHQHIYGLLFRLLWPLCTSRPFAANNLEFPEQIVQKANDSTTLISSPALLKRLGNMQNNTTSPLRCIFSSGGPLPAEAAKSCFELFGQLPIEVFGSTETGGMAHRQQITASTPWSLFPGVEADTNEDQCLRVRSSHINGDSWYQTADKCDLHDDLSFHLLGRIDRIVKIEEKRISLVEVESRLEQLSLIQESSVVSTNESNRISIFAVIVLTDDGVSELERLGKGQFWLALRHLLRDWLEPIAIPRKYRIVDEIPVNSQGKRQADEITKLFRV